MKNSFYSLEEFKKELKKDKIFNHRFPVRFILVESLSNWKQVVALLEDMSDHILRLSNYCSSDDVMPDLHRLKSDINQHLDNNLLIIPLAEHLRLFPDRRGVLKELATLERLGEMNCGTKKRVYIPLYAMEDIFYKEMENVSRFGEPNESAKHYLISNASQRDVVTLQIVPDNLNSVLLSSEMLPGLKPYFQIWEKQARANTVLSTRFARWIQQSSGSYSISVFNNSFELLVNKGQGCDQLKQEWGNETQWNWLASLINKGEHLRTLILRTFNLADFDVKSLFSRWKEYDDNQQWLAWLWCKIKQPSGYFGYVIKNSNERRLFEEKVINSIFDIDINTKKQELSILRERIELIQYTGIQTVPSTFWERFGLINDSVKKLKCLSGVTEEEKYKVIEVVAELLENKVEEEEWYDYLSIVYPELSYYLRVSDYNNETVYNYFYYYVRAKLVDKVDDSISKLVQDVVNKDMWVYPSRNSTLQPNNRSDILFYWVDGMGAEWLGLIEGILSNEFEDIEYEYQIARANLPTITACNKDWEWQQNYKIYRDYDRTIHGYACEYPKYIVEEFEHIKKIVRNAVNLLNDNSSVVITADHGTSRLAAINKQQSVSVSENVKVLKHGRYCINDGSLDTSVFKECVEEDNKLIFATYGRFCIGGNVPGEIHGGATLEEVLVPVITIKRKTKKENRVSFNLLSKKLKLNPKKEAVLSITLNTYVAKLTLMVRSNRFGAQYKDGKWQFVLKNMKPGKYKGLLYANNRYIGEIEFELTRGISIDDMGL